MIHKTTVASHSAFRAESLLSAFRTIVLEVQVVRLVLGTRRRAFLRRPRTDLRQAVAKQTLICKFSVAYSVQLISEVGIGKRVIERKPLDESLP